MKFSNDNIKEEYERCCKELNPIDDYEKINTIGIYDVIKAHYLIADFFITDANGEGIGGIGPKDINLLHSALYRPHFSFGGTSVYTNNFDMIATLLYGLIKNHPFYDANKRTAFLSTLYYLKKLGYTPSISHEEFEDFLVEIADDHICKRSRYKQLAKTCDDPEVKYISYFLKKNTRKIDKRQYLITYSQLKKILNNFNFNIANPSGNRIGVYQFKRKKLTFKKNEFVEKKIGSIGFPSWTRQVPKSELKRVREITQLTDFYGVDSQTFYNGIDDLEKLIAEYQEPLKRLADR